MARRPSPSRLGAGVVELIVALVLGLFIVHAGMRALVGARRAQASWTAQSERLATLRSVGILREDLAAGVEGRDWSLHAPDSVRIRRFVGVGLVCPSAKPGTGPAGMAVRWRGERAADPLRDSVLALAPWGEWFAADLTAVSSVGRPCPVATLGAQAEWRLDLSVPWTPVALYVFTTGSYHISGGALRFRRGLGGRQPLTPAILSTASRFERRSSGAVGMSLESTDGWRWGGVVGRRRHGR